MTSAVIVAGVAAGMIMSFDNNVVGCLEFVVKEVDSFTEGFQFCVELMEACKLIGILGSFFGQTESSLTITVDPIGF